MASENFNIPSYISWDRHPIGCLKAIVFYPCFASGKPQTLWRISLL